MTIENQKSFFKKSQFKLLALKPLPLRSGLYIWIRTHDLTIMSQQVLSTNAKNVNFCANDFFLLFYRLIVYFQYIIFKWKFCLLRATSPTYLEWRFCLFPQLVRPQNLQVHLSLVSVLPPRIKLTKTFKVVIVQLLMTN